MIHIK